MKDENSRIGAGSGGIWSEGAAIGISLDWNITEGGGECVEGGGLCVNGDLTGV